MLFKWNTWITFVDVSRIIYQQARHALRLKGVDKIPAHFRASVPFWDVQLCSIRLNHIIIDTIECNRLKLNKTLSENISVSFRGTSHPLAYTNGNCGVGKRLVKLLSTETSYFTVSWPLLYAHNGETLCKWTSQLQYFENQVDPFAAKEVSNPIQSNPIQCQANHGHYPYFECCFLSVPLWLLQNGFYVARFFVSRLTWLLYGLTFPHRLAHYILVIVMRSGSIKSLRILSLFIGLRSISEYPIQCAAHSFVGLKKCLCI